MVAFGIGELVILPLLWVVTMGAYGGVPLGVPPLPEDPVLSKVAPEKCLWYVSWSGTATPDPDSENHTDRLLAERELQELIALIDDRITQLVIRETARGGAEARAMRNLPMLVKTLLTRPTAAFLESIDLQRDIPAVRGGLIVNVGEKGPEVEAALKQFESLAAMGGEIETFEEGGATWRQLPLPEDAPPIAWTRRDRYIIVAVGEGSPAGMVQRAATPAPQWLTALREDLAVDRLSMVSHLNIEGLLALLGENRDGRKAMEVIAALGLDNLQSLQNVSGLDGEGCVSRTRLQLDGEPRGLLTMLDGAALQSDDLRAIPSDSIVAVGLRLDATKVYRTIMETIGRIEPRGQAEIEEELKRLEEQLGVDFLRDLMEPLGDVWTIYNSPGDGLVTGLTATVKVDDANRLRSTQTKLIALVRAMRVVEGHRQPRRGDVLVGESMYKGQTIHFLNIIGESPVAPAWCLVEDQLIVGLFPQAVKAHLDRDPAGESLVTTKRVRDALQDRRAIMFAYQDTRTLFTMAYPLLQVGAQLLCSEMQREGFAIDISALPSCHSIAQHLQPGVMTISRTDTGFEVYRSQTLPMMGGASGVLPVVAGVALPRVALTRRRAYEVAGQNQMRQVGIAMLSHAFEKDHYPEPYNVGNNARPLLSWRVHLLPYVEGSNLYERFHLDEPWDSEHNKKLIPLMPEIYKSPRSGAAAQFKTRYLAVRGPKTLFPGTEKITMRHVRDGTSNTIMLVEAAEDNAVIWTKPVDIEFDPDKPAAGLGEGGAGGGPAAFFWAVMADGSAHRVPIDLPKDKLAAFFTRDGGETVIDLRSPGTRRPQARPIPHDVIDSAAETERLVPGTDEKQP